MLFKKWDDLPLELKCDEVKYYYDILSKRKFSIFFKRLFDILLSLFLIILLSPLIIILAILIKIDSKGSVFYRQERVTTYGKKFKIFKFRTMVSNADKIGTLVTVNNDNRITKIGSKIRKYRLDEIPQLFNVFLGDMSFVGTRPEVTKYVDRYTNEMKATLLMKAGITSIASINFKDEDKIFDEYKDSNLTIDDIYIDKILPLKMKYNLEYLNKFNFFYDIKICFDTVFKVLK